jgi:hypothetical protein
MRRHLSYRQFILSERKSTMYQKAEQKIDQQTRNASHRNVVGFAAAVLCLAVISATAGQALMQSLPAPSAAHVATAAPASASAPRVVDVYAPQTEAAATTSENVRLVSYSVPLAAAMVRTGWRDTWGAYGRCVLGIGVPIGVAWYFVTALGSRAALAALRSQPAPPWAGAGAKRYANAVWNSCAQFLRS